MSRVTKMTKQRRLERRARYRRRIAAWARSRRTRKHHRCAGDFDCPWVAKRYRRGGPYPQIERGAP